MFPGNYHPAIVKTREFVDAVDKFLAYLNKYHSMELVDCVESREAIYKLEVEALALKQRLRLTERDVAQ